MVVVRRVVGSKRLLPSSYDLIHVHLDDDTYYFDNTVPGTPFQVLTRDRLSIVT